MQEIEARAQSDGVLQGRHPRLAPAHRRLRVGQPRQEGHVAGAASHEGLEGVHRLARAARFPQRLGAVEIAQQRGQAAEQHEQRRVGEHADHRGDHGGRHERAATVDQHGGEV